MTEKEEKKEYIRVYGKENELGEWVKPPVKDDDEYTYQWESSWVNNPDKPLLKITKSSLGAFKWCKKQYEFSYIDRRPVEVTEPMIKGTFIHDSVEDFYNSVDIKKAENMSMVEVKDYFTGLFPISDYMDLSDSIVLFQTQRFLDAKENNNLEEFLPAGNEMLFNARLLITNNLHNKYPLINNHIVHIQGIIDRIFKEGDSYIPMELKTGPWKDNKTGIRRELAFYKILMENSPDCGLLPINHWGWYYPASNHITVEKVKKATMTSTMKAIAELIYAYENNEFPTSFFHKKCVHCSFIDICPASSDSVKEESDWL
jgi:CRISPR/Cas system-associated exonuclease Cas4 (RecB family)